MYVETDLLFTFQYLVSIGVTLYFIRSGGNVLYLKTG